MMTRFEEMVANVKLYVKCFKENPIGELKCRTHYLFRKVNLKKAQERLTGAQLMLAVLAIASIAKHGFKEHMRRAWTTEPVKQFLLGVIAAFALVISCYEKDDDNL